MSGTILEAVSFKFGSDAVPCRYQARLASNSTITIDPYFALTPLPVVVPFGTSIDIPLNDYQDTPLHYSRYHAQDALPSHTFDCICHPNYPSKWTSIENSTSLSLLMARAWNSKFREGFFLQTKNGGKIRRLLVVWDLGSPLRLSNQVFETLVGYITEFCGKFRLRGGHLETKSQYLMYIAIEKTRFPPPVFTTRSTWTPSTGLIVEIARKRRAEKSTLAVTVT